MSSPTTSTAPQAPLAEPAGATPPERWLGLRPAVWGQIAVIALLFGLLFWPNLRRLWLKTNPIYGSEWGDWSHSMLVPILGLAYLWLRREELLSAPVRPLLADGFSLARWLGGGLTLAMGLVGHLLFSYGPGEAVVGSTLAGYAGPLCFGVAVLGLLVLALDWGLGTLAAGLLLMAYGIWPGKNDYLKDMGMILTLFGVVLTLTGWAVMRIAWFPIVYLICAIPWPGLVYTKIALPLQNLAAKVAVVVLNIAQVDSMVEGTRIVIEKSDGVTRILNVAQACAGMRSLMTFITLAAAMAFFSLSRPMWQKLVIMLLAVPIAIVSNVIRVSGLGLLDVYVTEQLSQGKAHEFVGMLVMLVSAAVMLVGVGWVLDRLFIVEEDDENAGERAPASAGAFGHAKGVA